MSDPVFPVDPVVVTGQRRDDPFSPFPKDIGGGGGESGPLPGGDQEIDDDAGFTTADRQCGIPENRKVWEADARAAQAVKDLMAFASSLQDGSTIFNREFGANLRYDGTTTRLSNMRAGTVSGVDIDNNEVTDANWMGDIHTHPSGCGLPSVADQTGFNDRMAAIGTTRSEAPYLAMYIIVKDDTASAGYRIYAYTKHSNMNATGREVDPDAQPCP